MRWLTLLTALPPKPTRHRVGVWRKLQRMGAVRLRGAGWILPENPETTELFQWLVQEIHSVRGEATLLRVDRVEPITDKDIVGLFHKTRAVEYHAVDRGMPRNPASSRPLPDQPPSQNPEASDEARRHEAGAGSCAGDRLPESARGRAGA